MLTANVVAAHMLMEMARQLRVDVLADQKIEGWKPSDHALSQDADEIENLASLILLGSPVKDLLSVMLAMDTYPREKVYAQVPEPLWNALGIEFRRLL